jgi:hypothetical protein
VVHKAFHTREDSGAALLIAIGILTVLLVIALAFFQITREEMQSADNYSSSIHADMLADGAIAMATAFLQHDELVHPTYTSLDHAWRSYFNGTWAGGKRWAWPVVLNNLNNFNDDQRFATLHGYPPLVNLEVIDHYRLGIGLGRLDLTTTQFIDQMYIPRIENSSQMNNSFTLREDIPMVVQPQFVDPRNEFRSLDNYITQRDSNGNRMFPFLISSDYANSPIMDYWAHFGLQSKYRRQTQPSDINPTHQLVMAFEDLNDADTQDVQMLPVEQIHFYGDVDLDGDGYHDAIWIPIAADRLFPNDGLDNDLDGFVDAEDLNGEPAIFMYRGDAAGLQFDGLDNDNDGLIDSDDTFDTGGGDNEIGEEELIVFTMPVDKMFSIYVPATENTGAYSVPVYNFDDTSLTATSNIVSPRTFAEDLSYEPDATFAPNTENAPYTIAEEGFTIDGNALLSFQSLDQSYTLDEQRRFLYSYKDDDYSGIVNDGVDARQYLLNEFVTPLQDPSVTSPDPDRDSLFYFYGDLIRRIINAKIRADGNIPAGQPLSEIRILGEPVSDIVSRVAILITDESSKANINEAGGRTYLRSKGVRDWEDVNFPNNLEEEFAHQWPLFASLSMGHSPAEYELSVLPNMNRVQVDRLWNFRTGAPRGVGFASFAFNEFGRNPFFVRDEFPPFLDFFLNDAYLRDDQLNVLHPVSSFGSIQPYYYDVSLPGYGRVDDNANAFLMAFDGIDNDGDSLYYQTDGIDNDKNGDVDEPGEGALVGTDEGFIHWDLDGDGVMDDLPGLEGIDEPSELQRFRPYRHFIAEQESGLDNLLFDEDFDTILDFDSFDNDGDGITNEIGELGDRPFRTYDQLTLALDFNRRDVKRIAPFVTAHSTDRNIRHAHKTDSLGPLNAFRRRFTGQKLDYNFASADAIAKAFLEDWDYTPTVPVTSATATAINENVENFAAGLRQEDTHVSGQEDDPALNFPFSGGPLFEGLLQHGNFEYVDALFSDRELRAHQLAVNIKDFTDTNHSRSELIVEVENADGTNFDPWMDSLGIQRKMYYTQTGIEDIRINEIMVRPVRRIEAEALANISDPDPVVDLIPAIDQILDFIPKPYINLPIYKFDPNIFSMPLPSNPLPLDPFDPGSRINDFDFYVTRMEDRLEDIFERLETSNVFYRQATIDDFPGGSISTPELFQGSLPFQYWASPTTNLDIFRANERAFPWMSMMGIKSAWTTYESTIAAVYQPSGEDLIENGNIVNERPVEIPNIIQFSFKASPQLPPGRYYLTLNSLLADNAPNGNVSETYETLVNTVHSTDDYAFFLRVGTAHEDVFSPHFSPTHPYPAAFVAEDDVEQEFWVKPAIIGYDDLGNNTGMSFMQASSIYRAESIFQMYNNEYSSIPVSTPGTYKGPGFTVVIPEIGDLDDPNYLHVAMWRTRNQKAIHGNQIRPLAINYFEFSQEPDHEWVELAHIDPHGEPVDLSNWILAVENTEPRREMIIPLGTKIAPGGYLLLGTNVRDEFEGTTLPGSRSGFGNNGIGLAKNHYLVSVPPTAPPFIHDHIMFGDDFVTVAQTQDLFYEAPANLYSVFNGPAGEDFIDNNGDGRGDALEFVADDTVKSSGASTRADSPFDRLIELFVPGLGNLTTAREIGEFVLRGGVFPNYPERDGIDNDGDRFYLETDGIDNDGDYLADIIPNFTSINSGVDEIGVIDLAEQAVNRGNDETRFRRFERSPNRFLPLSEGIDEGRWRRHHPELFNAAVNYVPGNFSSSIIPFVYQHDLFNTFHVLNETNVSFFPDNTTLPRWKEFMERRMYPGDNVIITLYEAPRSIIGSDTTENERVVDRITYTERDVVNRNIDDILSVDRDENNQQIQFARSPINWDFENMWPDNTMGIDFYRSLERKHPLYNGDRFGTRNRFQVTDGDYDDWSESTGLWQRINQVGAIEHVYRFFSVPALDARLNIDFSLPNPDSQNFIYRLHAHAYHGSPLRMNLSQRRMEDAMRDRGQGLYTDDFFDDPRGQFDTPKTAELPEPYRWPWLKPRLPNTFMTSPGELMTLSHFETDLHKQFVDLEDGKKWVGTEINTGQSFDYDKTNEAFRRKITYYYSNNEPVLNNQIMLSHRFPEDFRDLDNRVSPSGDIIDETLADDLTNDMHAVISNAASTDTLSLHIGTAEAFPLDRDTVTPASTPLSWIRGDEPPEEWSPLFLFEMPYDSNPLRDYPYRDRRGNYLYDLGVNGNDEPPYLFEMDPFADSLPDLTRISWPQPLRTVLFTSQNSTVGNDPNDPSRDRDNYNSATRKGANAYFVWDGSDGVENGEYDLFVGIGEPLDALGTIAAHYDSVTDFGVDFIDTTIGTDHGDMLVDIEVFTDKDGSGSTWNPNSNYPSGYADLNSGSIVSTKNESLGQIQEVVPDIDGFVHYGPVRIDHNHLGVFIRNRANTDVVNRFTRVVLTPRNKTAGRMNINTTMTRVVGASAAPGNNVNGFPEGTIFNPLTGLPGILLDYQIDFDEDDYQVFGTGLQIVQEDIGMPSRLAYTNQLRNRFNFFNPDRDVFDDPTYQYLLQTQNATGLSAAFRAFLLTIARPEHPDGRYYEHISDLIKPILYNPIQSNLYNAGETLATRQPNSLSEFSVGNDPNNRSNALNNDSVNFDESYERFRRTANLITTRSNVFEIIVKVQTGYVTDVNGDRILNYRDDNEFTVTGEKDARAIYER